jgi:hypothetical protein
MPDKYIYNNQGTLTEREAKDSSAGAGDAGKIVALDSTGRLSSTMMPVGMGADTKTITASENLNAGNFVNIWNDAGTVKVRKADATTAGKEANGFVLNTVTAGSAVEVYFEGTNTQLTGLTGGAMYFLSTTAGGVTSTAPSASGNIVQKLGRALSDTEINFEPSDPIVLA